MTVGLSLNTGMRGLSPVSAGDDAGRAYGAPLDAAGDGAGLSGLGQRQADFAAILSGKGVSGQTPRESAQDLVAISLVQPILAQLRATNQAAAPFAPSSGEKQFQSLADAQMARHIVRGGRFPLVDAIEKTLTRGAGVHTGHAVAPAAPSAIAASATQPAASDGGAASDAAGDTLKADGQWRQIKPRSTR